MWRPRVVLSAALCLVACTDDPTAVCSDNAPVHLLRKDDVIFVHASRAGGHTFLTTTGLTGTELFVGQACGVEPTAIVDAVMQPLRAHEDPDDDDPTIVCSARGSLFRVDLDGEAAPTLFMPTMDCSFSVRTEHGLLLAERSPYGLWLFPDFPELTSARHITADLDTGPGLGIAGDDLYYARGDTLHVHDLATGDDTPLLANVVDFTASETHVLWRERTDARAAPMRLLDRATGTSTYLGLYHQDEDERLGGGRSSSLSRAWALSPGGRFVLHFPFASHVPLAAYDLHGRALAFPAWGTPYAMLDDDTVILRVGEDSFAVRPGEHAVALDVPPGQVGVKPSADHLEILSDSALYHVPLDGAPRRLIARGVSAPYMWIDDDHLVTVHEQTLTTIEPSTTHRSELAHAVYGPPIMIPGEGIYYSVVGWTGHPWNGVWFVPEAGLRPPPARCIYFDACDE